MSRHGRYGNPDKKGTEALLQSVCGYINDLIKESDKSKENKESILGEINRAREILYGDGRVLSDTLKVRFESRLNNLEKKLMK
ncbi:hypothetical protein [Paenibacillus naphthalenovorans]|uniref:Uncharacterized protein n=1 Tax=Paenibacillus naphthalenovorans TaxID=162209 RepID=A0A0U2U7T8_9BACL|nr:hypothetical protein [Paenibacillus naphthalenovorans]ALS22248.1 hypothetical protein IJ22_18740 [Paenibacillus naphthalenovorans]